MPVSEKQKQYAEKHIKNTYDSVTFRVPKGHKSVLQAHAETQGESLNSFINRAANETMTRDDKKALD